MTKITSPNIVRVWFDTVLNPIISGLDNELYVLNKGNLTWRGFMNTFEELKPIAAFCEHRYKDNFEQILRHYPNLIEIISKYDELFEDLESKANQLYLALKSSNKLMAIYNNGVDNYANNNAISESKLKTLRNTNSYRFIAEYLINGFDELEPEYSLSPIWNKNIQEFKQLLNSEDFAILYADFKQSQIAFTEIIKQTITELKEVRFNLSEEADQPIVMLNEQVA